MWCDGPGGRCCGLLHSPLGRLAADVVDAEVLVRSPRGTRPVVAEACGRGDMIRIQHQLPRWQTARPGGGRQSRALLLNCCELTCCVAVLCAQLLSWYTTNASCRTDGKTNKLVIQDDRVQALLACVLPGVA